VSEYWQRSAIAALAHCHLICILHLSFLPLLGVSPNEDMVNVHVFSDDAEFILKVLDHYRKYGYKMAVTEFACINFRDNKKCDQAQTIAFIYRAVEIFEVGP
jgi:hypothetical protein